MSVLSQNKEKTMRTRTTRMLKIENCFNISDGRTQESTGVLRIVQLLIREGDSAELFQKEVLFCNIATD